MKNMLAADFHLYSGKNNKGWSSSFFDLISGDTETKQTKGLACLFAMQPELAIEFIKFFPGAFDKLDFDPRPRSIKHVSVLAEMVSINGLRVDIALVLTDRNNAEAVVMIEAKSVKVKVGATEIKKQINEYLEGDFPAISRINKENRIAVTLTKYQKNLGERVTSIKWERIVNLLDGYIKNTKIDDLGGKLSLDFLNFITGVDKGMHYYEEEVLTIPAGKTIRSVNDHKVYVCPANYKYGNKKSLYLGFRGDAGKIERLYKLRDIVELQLGVGAPDPRNQLETVDLDEESKSRVLAYIDDNKTLSSHASEDYKFFILDEDNIIPLPKEPRPPRNNTGLAYYSLAELITSNGILEAKGKKKEVTLDVS